MKGNFRNSIISGSSLFTFIPLYYILEYKMSVNIPKLHFLVDINMDINCQFCTVLSLSPCLHVEADCLHDHPRHLMVNNIYPHVARQTIDVFSVSHEKKSAIHSIVQNIIIRDFGFSNVSRKNVNEWQHGCFLQVLISLMKLV